ncbi:unnamed protein product [Chironomus riparius]|uniref:tRNA/rRNA methyltransferase SpoU type domain-containing protein n=1 Tax=Chironomus riparius TaxID=315576 RepID=A0A9N9S265_9DIPT|nr:unnamed protein product [Chironomus riparius]
MDSYEYYLLYHEDKNKFIKLFNGSNQEILIAFIKLYENGKIKEDGNEFFNKLLILIENDDVSNFMFDEILQQLITINLFESSKHYLIDNEVTLAKLRISKVLVDFGLNNNYSGYEFQQFCQILVDFIFKESSLRYYAIGILCQVLKKDKMLKDFILSSIYKRSLQLHNAISTQNLCYFFKHLCQNGLKVEELDFIEKYFNDETILARKQGTFLLKCLLDHNLLCESNDANWRKFITIMETLEENQSHLILPSLDLLHEMKINENFKTFWFILCTMVINHENSLVKSYGLKYIFGMREIKFKKQQVLKILEAVNVTYLFDSREEKFLKEIQKFVENNSEIIFELLIEINWFSVPFYYILESLKSMKIPDKYNKDFLACFEKQTELIPKRIRNIKIRGIVKIFYSNLLKKVITSVGIHQVLRTFKNIFHINQNHDCMKECINNITEEDYALIFSKEVDYEFVKYILLKTHMGKTIDEVKDCVKHIKESQKLVIEVMLDMYESMDIYEDVPSIIVNEMIKLIWEQLTDQKHEGIENALNLLELSLKTAKNNLENEAIEHITEIWTRINSIFLHDKSFEYPYLKSTNIILKHNQNFDSKLVENEYFSSTFTSQFLILQTIGQALIIKNLFINSLHPSLQFIQRVLENIEILLDRSSSESDVMDVYEILKIATLSTSKEAHAIISDKLKNIFNNFLQTSCNIISLSTSFWRSFIKFIWESIENFEFSISWMEAVEEIFRTFMDRTNENDRFALLLAMHDFFNEHCTALVTNNVLNYFKTCLIEAMFEVKVMTRDEQIENELVYGFDEETKQKVKFRLSVAKLLLKLYGEEMFSKIVGEKIVQLSVISKKKIRYYPNSNIHRLKLHHFQPLFFCKNISNEIIDLLIFELLRVNNQLNVIYILEIILASHIPDIVDLLNRDLNSQALKSIFSISIIQMKMETDFKKAEKRLDSMFKSILPFSMGQNFGVRIYSLLTIILSYAHIKTLPNFTETSTTSKMFEICKVIQESVKQKNCLKYFNALKNDFRFSNDYIKLNRYQVFYQDIPKATNMPFEEIIVDKNEDFESFFAADMLKEGDCIVMADEIEIGLDRHVNSGIVNLQKKYLPFKNQGPEENLLRTVPDRFKSFDADEACLKPTSELIVVASLIDNNTNLGGLARTCEIFGISTYVMHSLKSQENFEFKSLSRTSEKWIQISEIKNWQLFDYLIAMKQTGYTIVGAEQSGNSVSLVDVKMPRKCVLLLGNEKRGIPADLLGLLDLIIEIPQSGVVRSLNVHVAGAIMIWEYIKQHSFK